MRKLSATELGRLQGAAESTFNDTCNIITYTVTTDTYGDVVKTGVTASGVACGVEFTGGLRNINGVLVQVDYDAVIRLPVNTAVDLDDAITVVSKMGQTINQQFEVISKPLVGPSAIRLHLKRFIN